MKHIAILTMFLGLPGCMRALQGPAFNHNVQTDTIAQRCRTPQSAGGYPESPCSDELQADLDAMAAQASDIESIANGEKPK